MLDGFLCGEMWIASRLYPAASISSLRCAIKIFNPLSGFFQPLVNFLKVSMFGRMPFFKLVGIELPRPLVNAHVDGFIASEWHASKNSTYL